MHHTQSGRLIHQAMGRLIRQRTRFIIAHSFSTIQNADMILVMEQGRLAEMVTYAELLANGDLDDHLHSRQFKEDCAGREAPV